MENAQKTEKGLTRESPPVSQKKVEATLRFSDAAFKSLHESVIAVDIENTITYWNDTSEQVFAVKASEAVGKNLFNVIRIIPTSPGQIKALHQKLTDQGYDRNEVRYRTPAAIYGLT